MLFHAQLPKHFWVDAFTTAVYLINRLPSSVLHMQTPFYKLYVIHPTYASLKVFGCRCFPYLRDYSKNKFGAKSCPCAFLGYSPTHKGYRCLHPPSKRVYLSWHVVFYETIFPYANPKLLYSPSSCSGTLSAFSEFSNDIIVTSNEPSLLSRLVSRLSSEFSMKDLGPLHYFLGIEVLPFSCGLFLSQQKYAQDLLARFSMTGCNPIGTPLAQKHNLRHDDPILVDATNYSSIVGALQYLTLTHPDLTHVVNLVCQFMHQLGASHFQAIKRILQYLQGTLDYGLQLLSRSSLSLYGFSDTDWAGCLDTHYSTTGYCIYLSANCISWASKKQPTVSRSSVEVEYRSMSTTTAELTWLLFLLRNIGIHLPTPPVLFCDNTSALHLTVNLVFHARTKHIELDVHFVREKVVVGQLVTRFVPTHLQIADIFTKALSKDSFHGLRSKLGVMPPPTSYLRGSDKVK
jgi:hypothetical protein